ncbi:MAG TPA: Do family serine endopeptidase [Thermoanaerobaculia bacterium]|jgi:serine protease Do|nr:Do family serine endopeptidase [Thermoanaerobaculia bacterium]
MNAIAKRQLSLFALIAGAVIFGVVLASSMNWTPVTSAQHVTKSTTGHTTSMTLPSFAEIAQEALPSVVSITSTDIVKGPRRMSGGFGGGDGGSGDPFQFFFGFPHPGQGDDQQQEHKEEAGGSGFILSEDGYILTNNHVVENGQKIEVKVGDQHTYKAKVVGTDPATDIALLKIDAKEKLTPIALGDSDKLRVGDWVMAIGDPWAFDKTVTVGVVSAKGRRNLTLDPNANSFENFIQTDAAINFGNSGGPLIDVEGQVIGINTAIYRPAQNIGFAVPINTAKAILEQLKTKGKVTRGFLGVNIRNIDEDNMRAFGLSTMNGALVESIEPDSPAEKAGVLHGDVIVKVDDREVKDTQDLISYVSSKPPGSKVRLSVLREGKTRTLTVDLGERRAEAAENAAPQDHENGGSREKIGLSVQDLTGQARQYYRIDPSVTGVLVTGVSEVSAAADAGLAEGDVITEVNGRKVGTAAELSKIVRDSKKGEYLRFYVRRFRPRPVSFFAIVKVGE